MIKTLKTSAYKNGYLLITAAWLYTLSILFINYWSYNSSPGRVKYQLERYLKEQEQVVEQFTKDTAVLTEIINKQPSNRQLKWMSNEQPRLFAYVRNDIGNDLLAFWNNHEVEPQLDDVRGPDGKKLVKYPSGVFEFAKKTVQIGNTELVAIGLIPIQSEYFTKSSYLTTSFKNIKGLDQRYKVALDKGAITIENGDGKVLFYLQEKAKKSKDYYDSYTLALRVLAIIFVLIFLNVLASDVVKKHRALTGILFLFAVLLLVRTVSYFTPLPFNYTQFQLFDPGIYASNTLHPSLGDLLINMILLFWLVSFSKTSSINYLQNLKPIRGKKALVLAMVLGAALVAISMIGAGVVRSLITDAKISFDVAHFFSLSIYTFISFLILCFITLTFFSFSHILLVLFNKLTELPWWTRYLAVTLCGLVYLTFKINTGTVSLNLAVLGWLLAYMFILNRRKDDLYKPLMRSSVFLLWLVFFAASITSLIINQNRILEYNVRVRTAGELAMQFDPSGQNTLSLAVIGLTNNFFTQQLDRLQQPKSNRFIKDSIINESFSGYISKYDTEIYTYDSIGNALYNDEPVTIDVFRSIVANGSKKTNIPGMYYYARGFDNFSYIFQKIIQDTSGATLGYFYMQAKPKQYKSEALVFELFKQGRSPNNDPSILNAYAVYDKGRLIANYGDYNFMAQLPKHMWPRQESENLEVDGKDILWFNAGNNKIVVIVKSGTLLFEVVTLFAYLFGSFLFILILFHAGDYMIRTRFKWRLIKETFRFNIRNQIQTTILFISVFSFIVIGAVTISFYIARFESNNRQRLVNGIQIMAKEVQSQIAAHELADDAVRIYDEGATSQLEQSIENIAEIQNVDVNFYGVDGTLKVSTQPYMYKQQILSKMINPLAYHKLYYNSEIQVIQQEMVGQFTYLSVYVPVRDQGGQPYAFINIPYIKSQDEVKQEISNFLVTLINLNAFIFVLAGVIAVLLTNRITSSFSLISSKMKDINLGKVNEEITWDTNDEIGALVIEYNKMVHKLEESAQALAKSEREGAWREMARQVAHEIKNPLTPMKLSIQYLQRSIEENKPGIQALSQKVAATLVEQINQLAKIASDFSQFANIGHVQDEVFNVNDVLGSLVDLYSTNPAIQLEWERVEEPIFISADKTQVNRLFTNLLQNAIEAGTANGQTTLRIREQVKEESILISITDHGTGIPEEMKEKIFTPNFTTKSSGTGLGLAICKGIVEKANGSIWFETEENVGTTFYVQFPLVNAEV